MVISLLRVLGLTLLVCALLFMGTALYVIDREPLVAEHNKALLDNAESVGGLVNQLKASLRGRYSKQHIMITVDQLNSIVGLMQRAVPQFAGVIKVSGEESVFNASLTLPENPFGRYVNIEAVLHPGDKVNLDSVSVGGIPIPGSLALFALETAGNMMTESDVATELVAHVDRVQMFPSRILVTVQPLDSLLKKLNTFRSGISVSKNEALRLRTAYYLKFLSKMPVARNNPQLSLVSYLSPLFAETSRQSVIHNPEQENAAAILALAVYTGHHRFANFIGDIQPSSERAALPRYRPVLAGRRDLTQHFVLSAGIKVLSDQGVSAAIGEFKELMDRANGGSGYSFTDLAADMAGVRFAELATDPEFAREFQTILAENGSEQLFFPPLEGLPEDLNKQDFVSVFGHVDSPSYKSAVGDIAQRINGLEVYQLGE